MKRALKKIVGLAFLLPALAVVAIAQETGAQIILPQGGYADFRVEISDSRPINSSKSKFSNTPLPFDPQVIVEPEGILHRLLVREDEGVVFGYDLVILPVPASKQFKVTARPLDPEFAATLDRRGSKTPTLLAPTTQQLINDGETLALDLLVNEQLSVKYIDYVRISAEREVLPSRITSPVPRDFTLANVQLSVKNYLMLIDGQPVRTLSVKHDCNGALIWFSLPDGGRFVFSLVPYAGFDFRKVGVIDNNRISFNWNDTLYEWISSEPVVGSGGKWNVWVLHDSGFVDLFAPPKIAERKREAVAGRVLRDPIEVLVRRKPSPTFRTLKPNDNTSALPPRPMRIRIGGMASVEELLANK